MMEKTQHRTCKIIVSVVLLLIIATAVILKISWKSSPCVLTPTPSPKISPTLKPTISPTPAASIEDVSRDPEPDSLKIIATISASDVTTLVQPAEDLYEDRKLVTVISASGNGGHASIVQIIGRDNVMSICPVPYANVRKPIRRLSRHVALFLVNDNLQVENERSLKTKLVLLNTTTCEHKYVYDGPVPANLTIRIKEDSDDERFTVIMGGKEFCNGSDWCRLIFDPQFSKLEPLNFDFDFSIDQVLSIEEASVFGVRLFAVRFTDDMGTHRVRLYNLYSDRTGPNYKELFKLGGYEIKKETGLETKYDLMSSRLSYCWRLLQKNELPTPIHCLRFHYFGGLIFNKTIEYSGSVQNLQVKDVSDGLDLFSLQCNKTTNECPIINLSTIRYSTGHDYNCCFSSCYGGYGRRRGGRRRGRSTKYAYDDHQQYNFEYSGCNRIKTLKLSVQSNVYGGLSEARYLCGNGLNYTFGVFSSARRMFV